MNFLKKLLGIKTANDELEEQKLQSNFETQNDDFDSDQLDDFTKENVSILEKPKTVPYYELPYYIPSSELSKYEYPKSSIFRARAQNILDSETLNSETKSLPFLWSLEGENVLVKDLEQLTNVLITGTQASGKTTLIHQFIISLLLRNHPSQLKLVLADSKGIELNNYKYLENHFLAKLPGESNGIIEDFKTLSHTLNALCIEMDNRYDLLKEAGTRNIKEYNEKFIKRVLDPQKGHQYLPSIVLIIDDLASYLLYGEEIFFPLDKLIRQGYKIGIYSIIGTSQLVNNRLVVLNQSIQQKVVFRLNDKKDFKRYFNTPRFDHQLIQGEFLYNDPSGILKGKTLLLDFEDIDKLVNFIADQRGYPQAYLLPEYIDETELEKYGDFDDTEKDPLFDEAARLIVQNQVGSTSLLQRRMKLGYNRAGRLMDQLEAAGVVGKNQGSKARDVIIKNEEDLQEYLDSLDQ